MELAYRYRARDSRQRPVSGLVFAADSDLAFAKLKRNGFKPSTVVLSAPASLQHWLHPGFDERDLVRFYRTLGRRLLNGRSLDEGLSNASQFVRDEKLRQAALLMRQAMLDGRRESDAMQQAGFPRRDAMVIRAAEKSGRAGEMFMSLADDVERAMLMRQSVRQIFRVPVMMALLVYGFLYVVIHWLSPRTILFLDNIGAQLPAFNRHYFSFVTLFNEHIMLATSLYLLLPVAVYSWMKSNSWRRLVDRIGSVRELSSKADYAALWHGFSLLYDAAIAPMEAARTMSDAAERPDARDAFLRLEKSLCAGAYLDQAVERAQFPEFITDGVCAAAASGNVVAGLNDMTQDLADDVQGLTRRLREDWSLVSLFVMAGLVVAFFFVSYYPMIAVAMKNV